MVSEVAQPATEAGNRVCEQQMVDDSDVPAARSLRWIALLTGDPHRGWLAT
jgi:hypothetical protein